MNKAIKDIMKKFRLRLKSFGNVKNKGKNNKIILVSPNKETEIKSVLGFKVSFKGNNNIIRIPEGYNIKGRIMIKSDNCLIDIKSKESLNIVVATCHQSGQKLVIDEGTAIYDARIFLNEKNASVLIGKNCLLSQSIAIWPTDGHSIIDNETNTILNNIKHPIVIGDNCWIGYGTLMTKNAYLSNSCVVGGG